MGRRRSTSRYLALGIGAGDEVIQPAINFVAAANTTVAVGATPVFADIVGLDEPTIDPAAVERLITPRTRAVVVMHYGGYPGRLAELTDALRTPWRRARRGCLPRGRCALSRSAASVPPHGAQAGTVGDIGCFSFFSNKNLATGEGGLVVTNRDDLAERLRLLRSHGMTTLTWDRHRGHAAAYDVVAHGYNYRLDELHAALGRVQSPKLPGNNARRARLADAYRRALRFARRLDRAVRGSSGRERLSPECRRCARPRDAGRGRRAIESAGIQTSLHYPCVADFTAFASLGSAGLERSREFTSRAITLPSVPDDERRAGG